MTSNSAGDPLLDTLGAALAQATSNDDRVKVLLAIELRKHLLSEQAKFSQRHQALRSKYTRAQEAHRHSTESLERDSARLAGLLQHGSGGGIQTLIKHSLTKDKQRARESLEFSQMMADGTRRDVDQALAGLMACEQEHDESIRRLRIETQLACMACQSLLERTEVWCNNGNGMPDETISIVEIEEHDSNSTQRPALLAPLPPPPPPPPPPLLPPPPPPPPSPRTRLAPDSQQSVAAKLPQPLPQPLPRPRPPLPTQPKPAHALTWRPTASRPPSIPSTRRPFTITCESTQQARHQFQQSIPPQYLFAGSAQEISIGETANQQIRRMLFGHLWTCVRSVLDSQHVSAELREGVDGFGADAYISVLSQPTASASKLLSMPIAIVDTFGMTLSSVQRQSPVSVNHRAIATCVTGYSKRTSRWICDYRAVESAIRRLVLLISTEPLACGAGMIMATEGVLLVRRTGQMSVTVSELYPCQHSAPGCHPVAATAHFVCAVSQQAVARSIPLFEPPVFL